MTSKLIYVTADGKQHDTATKATEHAQTQAMLALRDIMRRSEDSKGLYHTAKNIVTRPENIAALRFVLAWIDDAEEPKDDSED
jgi:hypothetical protein